MLIDISPLITAKIAVFPGDTPFVRRELMSFKKHHHLTLSSIETTVHLGAHVDAPNHYDSKGEDIASRSLDYYLGDCQVIQLQLEPPFTITKDHLLHLDITQPRVLFKTLTFLDPDQWVDDFAHLSAEAIEWLAERAVKLVGIDTPSIDHSQSKELPAHKAVAKNNMAILEGIILEHVTPGPYELIALPLKIATADASPVRAILRTKGKM